MAPYTLFCLETQLQPFLQKWSPTWFPKFRLYQQQATLRIYDGEDEISLPNDIKNEIQTVVDLILEQSSTVCRLMSVADFPDQPWAADIFQKIVPPIGIQWRYQDGIVFVELPADQNYLEIYNLLTVGLYQLISALDPDQLPQKIIGTISAPPEYTDLTLDPTLEWTF